MRYLKLLVVFALLSASLAFAGGASAQDEGQLPTPTLGVEVPEPAAVPSSPSGPTLSGILPDSTRGDEALAALDAQVIAEAAAQNGMATDAFTEILANDDTAWLDPNGVLLYMDPPGAEAYLDEPVTERGPFPNNQTFLLHSRPGSSKVIHLDFDGYALPAGTSWNDGAALNALPYDTSGNGAIFNQAEHDVIQSVFQRVSEDYAAFDVDVTTQDPGFDAINRSGSADTNYGTRLVFTNTPNAVICGAATPCGGIAFVGVFDHFGGLGHAYFQPAWVFSDGAGTTAKGLTEAGSHEVGHNVGLSHDGPGYYAGHGMWAPIMGVAYNQPVSQWSKGEYTNANQTEDDFVVMQANGLAQLADEAGCSGGQTNDVNPGQAYVINPAEASADSCDAFRYIAPCTGSYTIVATPDPGVSPNLSLALLIFDWDTTTLLQQVFNQPVRVNDDVASGMGEQIVIDLVGGEDYLLAVFPLANGTPSTGWSNYGNVGRYEIVPFTPGGCVQNNDQFLLADTIGGPSATVNGSNAGYTNEPGEPDPTCDFGSPLGPSAWWNWTAPSTGRVNMNTVGSNFDTVMAVYTGSSVGSLTEVACNDQNGLDNTSEVSFNATAGTTYRIQVYGYYGQTGNIVLNTRPTPFVRPFGTVVAEGDSGSQVANLTVFLEDAAGNPYASPTPVSVNWTTVDIPSNPKVAHPGSDYIANSGVLTFAPGQTQATVPVTVLGDTVVEPPLLYGEWGLASFTGPSSNALVKQNFFGLGLLIIVDDD